eukprot:503116_1
MTASPLLAANSLSEIAPALIEIGHQSSDTKFMDNLESNIGTRRRHSSYIDDDDEVRSNDGKHECMSTIGISKIGSQVGEYFRGHHMSLEVEDEIDNIPDEPPGYYFSFKTLMAYLGPGYLISIAFLDPGNLEADLQAGAYTGLQLLWVLLVAHIVGFVLQGLSARLGVVTGKHLAVICREGYPRVVYIVLWIMMELAIIGSDIQEVLGSAIALNILTGAPLWLGCIVTVLDTFIFLLLHIYGIRKLEALFMALVGVMTIAFCANFFVDSPPSRVIFSGFVPRFKQYAAVQALGLIGSVIMPHNLYLHSALVLSRKLNRADPRKLREANKYYIIDAFLALAVAFIINLAVVATFANQFYDETCATASTLSACLGPGSVDKNAPSYGTCAADGIGICQEIGLVHAGDALSGALGGAARYVWAVGLLAAGQSSTMTGTYAGQFCMSGFLDLQIQPWQRMFLTRSCALVPALIVVLVFHNNETASDAMSEWLNVLQSIVLPFAIIPLLHFSSSEEVMREFVIPRYMKVFLWILSGFVIVMNVVIVVNSLSDFSSTEEKYSVMFYIFMAVIAVLYIAFTIYLCVSDAKSMFTEWSRGTWTPLIDPNTEYGDELLAQHNVEQQTDDPDFGVALS